MDKKEEIFEVTKIISNIRNNNYTVGDYKLCESESKVVLRALEEYLANIKFDELEVVNTLESAI